MDAGRGDRQRRQAPSETAAGGELDRPDGGLLERVLETFDERFPDEPSCGSLLHQHRWPQGFRCPACGASGAWETHRGLLLCSACRHQTSATAGTALDRTRLSAQVWLRSAWLVTARPIPPSASALQEVLGLGSHETASRILRTLRQAMAPDSEVPLHGTVCLSVAPLGRASSRQKAAAIAVRVDACAGQPPSLRVELLGSASVASVARFVADNVRADASLVIDPTQLLRRFTAMGLHIPAERCSEGTIASVPRKAFLSWLHHVPGGRQVRRMQGLLDEFAFRFANRGRAHDELFDELVRSLVRPLAPDDDVVIRLRPGVTDDRSEVDALGRASSADAADRS